MASKDKKTIVPVIGGVTSALRKAYDVLNRNEHLPEVENAALPGLANHIIRALQKDLAEIEENERFDGLEYDQIVELKNQERKQQLTSLRDQAGELLKALRAPEPVLQGEEQIIDPNLDNDADADQDEDPESDPDENSDAPANIVDPLLADLSLKDLIDRYNKSTEAFKNIDINSEEFESHRLGLLSLKTEIENRRPVDRE